MTAWLRPRTARGEGEVSVPPRPMRRTTIAAVCIVALAAVRAISGESDLTSSGTFRAALLLAVPIGLAGLGGLFSERAGVVNIGLEGMMIFGTWFGAWAGWQFGPWWGVVLGVLGGAAGGLLHAVATVTFGVDQIVSGVAVNILGLGVARFLSVVAYDPSTGGGVTQSPRVQGDIPDLTLPFLSGGDLFGWRSPDLLGWVDRQDWFLASDVTGMVRGVTRDVSVLTLVALALVPLTWWVVWRTPFGLRLRSAGEHPVAADSLGVPVYRMKYAGVVLSGALCGLAGAFLVLEFSSVYREGQTAGRGYIGLAALIFGNWNPVGLAVGAGLFGFADALQLRDEQAVHALLLFVAIVAALAAVRAVHERRNRRAAVLAAVAVAFGAWYGLTDEIPTEFVSFTPHVVTLLVLSLSAQRLRMPAADGLPYRRGQRG
jgi:general nucleoside transport system permease protein